MIKGKEEGVGEKTSKRGMKGKGGKEKLLTVYYILSLM